MGRSRETGAAGGGRQLPRMQTGEKWAVAQLNPGGSPGRKGAWPGKGGRGNERTQDAHLLPQPCTRRHRLILRAPRSCHYHLCFTDEKTEARRREETQPRSRNWSAEGGFGVRTQGEPMPRATSFPSWGRPAINHGGIHSVATHRVHDDLPPASCRPAALGPKPCQPAFLSGPMIRSFHPSLSRPSAQPVSHLHRPGRPLTDRCPFPSHCPEQPERSFQNANGSVTGLLSGEARLPGTWPFIRQSLPYDSPSVVDGGPPRTCPPPNTQACECGLIFFNLLIYVFYGDIG